MRIQGGIGATIAPVVISQWPYSILPLPKLLQGCNFNNLKRVVEVVRGVM